MTPFKKIGGGRETLAREIRSLDRRIDAVRREILNRRVLVVDDSADFRGSAGLFLENWGFHPLFAGSAEEAVQIMDDCIIWVALIDLKLPGANGVDLCRRIRGTCPLITCFAVTGHPGITGLADLRAAGFEDVFIKPFDWDLMRRGLDAAMDRLNRWADLP